MSFELLFKITPLLVRLGFGLEILLVVKNERENKAHVNTPYYRRMILARTCKKATVMTPFNVPNFIGMLLKDLRCKEWE